MSYPKISIWCWALLMLAAHGTTASAHQTIAHRGVFHDVNDNQALAENSYQAVIRAYDLGLKGVELDLRLDAEGNVLVTHDMITNRTTLKDNLGAGMNPIDVALNLQSTPNRIYVSTLKASQWNKLQLKWYGRNGRMNFYHEGGDPVTARLKAIQSLRDMLTNIRNNRASILKDKNFMFILDIQDHRILKAAATIVKDFGVTDNFYLKFFASKGLSGGYKYNGSHTCYEYAKNNNLTYTKIIPQINDGELDIYDNNNAGVYAFGKTLSIDTYLQCWADAQAQHTDAARMPIVSASVPAEDWNATAGAFRAIYWAQSHGRQTMTIVPNPDAGRYISKSCRLFSFQSTNVSATSFNMSARQAKANFAANSSVRPTYIIWDVMGDKARGKWNTNFDYFIKNLC